MLERKLWAWLAPPTESVTFAQSAKNTRANKHDFQDSHRPKILTQNPVLQGSRLNNHRSLATLNLET
jgi:hypothetical protein